jgi:hypothetical protein
VKDDPNYCEVYYECQLWGRWWPLSKKALKDGAKTAGSLTVKGSAEHQYLESVAAILNSCWKELV